MKRYPTKCIACSGDKCAATLIFSGWSLWKCNTESPKTKRTGRRFQLSNVQPEPLMSKINANIYSQQRHLYNLKGDSVFSIVTEAWQVISAVAIHANYAFPALSGLHSTQPVSQRALFGRPCVWWAIIGHTAFVQAVSRTSLTEQRLYWLCCYTTPHSGTFTCSQFSNV